MDSASQEKFDRIVRTEPAGLTPGDIDFLRVRRSYLTSDQRKKFASVLEEEPRDETEPDEQTKKAKK